MNLSHSRLKLRQARKKARKAILQTMFPDVIKFIKDLYAMEKDPSYYIKLPRQPHDIRELLEP